MGKEADGVFPSSLLFLVKELLAVGSLLAGASGLLVEELLLTGSLQASASVLLFDEL
jgi:hypothetical protein